MGQSEEALATILHVENSLKHYQPDSTLEPSNAYSPFYKDMRMERFTAWTLTDKDSALGAKCVSHANRLIALLNGADSKLGSLPQHESFRGRLHFAKARVHALIAQWQAARSEYEKALVCGFDEGPVRYYMAITFDLDGAEVELAKQSLRRAIAVAGGDSKLGAQCAKHLDLLENTPSPTAKAHGQMTGQKEAKSGGCFIATAACGSAYSPEVMVLSAFRDDVLLQSRIGKMFVRLYYAVSPPTARIVVRSHVLQQAVMTLFVRPAVGLVRIVRRTT